MKKTAKSSMEAVIDITCDACGESVVPDFHKAQQVKLESFNEFGVLQASFGYGSSHDGESFHFDLCETCFAKLVESVEQLRVAHGLSRV